MQSKTSAAAAAANSSRNGGAYKDYLRFYKLYAYAEPFDYLLILLGTVGGLLAGSALPLAAYLFGSALDDVAWLTDPHKQLQKMSETALHAVFVGLISAGGYFFQAACWMSIGERQAAKMGYLYLQALLRQDLSFFDQEISTGAVVEGLSADTFIIKQATGEKVGKFIQIIGTLLSGYVIAFTQGWKLTLFVSAMMPLIVASIYVMDLIVSKTSRKVLEANGDAAKIVEQVVSAIRTVVVPFGGEKKAIKAYDKVLEKSKNASFHESIASGVGMGMIMFVTFNMYAAMLWFGAELILSDGYTGGKVLTIIFSIVVGTGVLGQCTPSLTAMGAGCVAAQRMYRVINRVPIVDMADETGLILDQDHFKGEIQLNNVTFSYPSRPGHQIFSGINLLIKAGSITALVGGSGSGKSTIVSLIQRFYDPQDGDVLVDKVSLKLLRLSWFRRQVGLVPQEPILLGGTVRENIAYGRDEGSLTTDEEIRIAATMANASKFIEQLPQGLDTIIGQGGFQLSGGQKQRIAIARAVLKDPRILLLDEATSALDAESESLVHEALHKIMCNRTTLVIAHRLTTLKAAHQITVLHQGSIIEQGTHEELINKSGGLLSQLMEMEESRYRSIQEEEELQIIRSGAGTPARLRGTPNRSAFCSPQRQLSTISMDSFKSATSFSNTPNTGFRSPYATPGRAFYSPVGTPSRGFCSPLGTPSRTFGSPPRQVNAVIMDYINSTVNAAIGNTSNIQLPIASNVQCNNMVQGEPGESQRMLLGEMFKLENSFEEGIDDLNDHEMICYELEDISSTLQTPSSLSSSNPNFLRLASYLKRREIPLLMIGSVAACANGAVMPVVGYLFASIIHTFYEPTEQIRHSCLVWIHLFIVVACITLLLTPIQNMCFSICGEKLVHQIRLLTFNIVLHQPMQWFDSPHNASGILSSRLLRDASQLKVIVGDALSLIVQNMSTVVVGLFIAMSTCWQLALLIVGLLPLYGLNGYIQIRMGEALDARAKIMYQETSQLAHDALGSIRTVASFCAEKKILSCYHAKSSVYVKSGYRRAFIAGVGMAVSYVVMFGLLGLSFWAGGRLVFSDKVTFDGFVKTFLAVELSAVAVSLSLAVAPDVACAKPALASIFNILDLPYKDLGSGLQLDQLRGEIQFQNVCFAYPLRKELQIFHDLSFTVQPGKNLAIVGESGGGKSTVLALMQKLYEVNAGYIKLDKIDINLLQTKWLRRQIGIVSQEPVLFNDTIRANIKYGMITNDDEDDTEVLSAAMGEQMIIRAAEVANAHKFISGLPDGYESMVGERGVQLSGGQKQRIAIARALVRDPRMLLLDEATSALDVGAEIVVQAALEKAAIGRSTIIVAHRLSTVRNAHSIIVLKDGCVAEQGSHDHLILNHPHGLYSSLVRFSSTGNTHS